MSSERPEKFKAVREIPPVGTKVILRRIVQIGGESFEVSELEQDAVVTRPDSVSFDTGQAEAAGCVAVSQPGEFGGEPRVVPFMEKAEIWGQLPVHALKPGMVAVSAAFEQPT
jgi:hypothetical protein